MLHEVKWIVSGQILGVQFSGSVNRAQIHEMNQIALAMLNTEGLPPAAHVIIDVSLVTHYERDMMSVQLLQNVIQRHKLIDWVIIVDPYPNAIVRFVGMTLGSLLKFRYHVTKTLDEAVAFLTPRLSQSAREREALL
jgi:hypothetical protein